MARTPEGIVKDNIKKFLKARGAWFFCPMQNGMGVVGVPDFIICHNGCFYAIEAKAPGKRGNVSANQHERIMEIHKAGGVAVVVDDVSQLHNLFTGNHNEA